MWDRMDTTNGETISAGDIVACGPVVDHIGTKERHAFVWLLIRGLGRSVLDRFEDINIEPLGEAGSHDDLGIPYLRYDKRRFCIPLDRLVQRIPTFNETRALDENDLYQPFAMIDSDNGEVLTWSQPLWAQGLVYDKAKMRYLK